MEHRNLRQPRGPTSRCLIFIPAMLTHLISNLTISLILLSAPSRVLFVATFVRKNLELVVQLCVSYKIHLGEVGADVFFAF